MRTNPKLTPRELSKRRIRITEIGSIIVCLLFICILGGKYLVLPMVSASYQATKNTVTYETIADYVVEGDILDRNANLIMGNATAGEPATANYPENISYSYLLGYYSVSSGVENTYGLRGNLKDYSLFHLDSSNKGATTYLTTDTGLQDFAYDLIDEFDGSITVIDNDTGAILALASSSGITYDVNDISTLLNSDVEGSHFRRGTYENDPPGSTYKVVTAAAALTKAKEEGLDSSFFDYYDDGTYVPENSAFTITNYGDRAYGDINLETALNNSVNTYFADLGVRTGAEQLEETARAFKVGESIEIPFLTTLQSSLDLGDGEPEYLAQVSFGQGNTEITPVHLTLIAQAIANNGVMMHPYIVERISQNSIPYYQHIQSELSTCIDEEVDAQLKDVMHSTAVSYGFDEGTYGMVYAKTGTAECANDRIHTYIIGFTSDASFCISINDGALESHQLYPYAQQLVLYLNSMYS